MDAGADRNMRTRDGNQLLTLAVDAKDEELVEILSPKTIDNVDSTGYTALYRYDERVVSKRETGVKVRNWH